MLPLPLLLLLPLLLDLRTARLCFAVDVGCKFNHYLLEWTSGQLETVEAEAKGREDHVVSPG